MADRAQIIHLLRRTEFVVKPARLKALEKLTLEQAVDNIFDFSQNPRDTLPAPIRKEPERWQNRDIALRWWVRRMATVPRPLQEKMTMFWHGHFVSSWDKVSDVMPMLDQNRLFRRYAVGDMRVLTQKMSLQPAMLHYLDNLENSKWSPNQNFARELMELFTLGVTDPETGKPTYSERDVQSSSRAWTGHGINWDTGKYTFYPDAHDTETKVFFGKKRNWDGPDIIDEILRDNPKKQMIAARFITRKLWDFFAYPLPAGPVPPALSGMIDTLSWILVDNRMRIEPMLKAMFLRPEFYSTTARQGLVRTPTEYAVALAHHSPVPLEQWLYSWDMEGTGQVPFWPPNVSGWRHNGYWVNTTAFSARGNMARTIAWRMAGWDSEKDRPQPLHDKLEADSPAAAYKRVATIFYRDPDNEIGPATRKAIMTWLENEQGKNSWHLPEYLIGMFLMAPEFHVA